MAGDGFTTCLWFDGQAEEAARFYTSVFENSSVGRVTPYPEGAMQPAGSVMTVEFTLDGQQFVGLNGGPQFRFSEATSFMISCETQEEIDYYWDRLTGNGGEPGPCGWLKDRFGVSWQVNPARLQDMVADPDPEKAARVAKAFMAMGKFDIAALERAYAGE